MVLHSLRAPGSLDDYPRSDRSTQDRQVGVYVKRTDEESESCPSTECVADTVTPALRNIEAEL